MEEGSKIRKIAFVGDHLPRKCGIATFTSDLLAAVAAAHPQSQCFSVSVNDIQGGYEYPQVVRFEIEEQDLSSYLRAADFLNISDVDIVCLQHEFGIFGGPAGGHILALLRELRMPIVVTFHTVLRAPRVEQRLVMQEIIALSTRLVVMSARGRQMLQDIYHAPPSKIDLIHHGIPDIPFVEPDDFKEEFGVSGRPVLFTFGLLSPNKGIEHVLNALPAIVAEFPKVVYMVVGATHPNEFRDRGEAYRVSLEILAAKNKVEKNVIFYNSFVDLDTLKDFIGAADIYVTPYLNEAQSTSGTLAYTFGSGKPVVSTPYWHASELLANGLGVLVPFGDATAIGSKIAELLTDDVRRQAMCRRAYAVSRTMTWERTAEHYMSVFESASQGHWLKVIAPSNTGVPEPRGPAAPDMQIGYFLSMCDDTALFQHAVHSVPDRSHGYCVDDNARAMLLACALNSPGEQPLSEILTARFAAFVQHAWNPDTGRFRNFMGFNRTWLEASGSEDSHARTLWALGETARSDATPSRRQWAVALFAEALSTVETFRSPRAWAFTLLGLGAYCAVAPDDLHAQEIRHSLADRLMSCLASVETPDWVWFEEGLAYDNARLPQALMMTGAATQTPEYVQAGLRSLRWLMTRQTTPAGHFRPVGTAGFGELRQLPRAFDQQPVEATATIAACLTAWRADGDAEWKALATRAFTWFLGSNDLSVALVDPHTGSCRDGLHPDRANEHRGGESVVG